MDTWVVSVFGLLWIMLLGALADKHLFEFLFSVALGIYLGMEVLAHMVILCTVLNMTHLQN